MITDFLKRRENVGPLGGMHDWRIYGRITGLDVKSCTFILCLVVHSQAVKRMKRSYDTLPPIYKLTKSFKVGEWSRGISGDLRVGRANEVDGE